MQKLKKKGKMGKKLKTKCNNLGEIEEKMQKWGEIEEKTEKPKNRFFVQIPVFYFRPKNRFKPNRF